MERNIWRGCVVRDVARRRSMRAEIIARIGPSAAQSQCDNRCVVMQFAWVAFCQTARYCRHSRTGAQRCDGHRCRWANVAGGDDAISDMVSRWAAARRTGAHHVARSLLRKCGTTDISGIWLSALWLLTCNCKDQFVALTRLSADTGVAAATDGAEICRCQRSGAWDAVRTPHWLP